MITNGQARELLNAIETYGDRERHYGKALEHHIRTEGPDAIMNERHALVTGELDTVKRLLRDLIHPDEEKDHLFDVPDRGEAPEPTWYNPNARYDLGWDTPDDYPSDWDY